MSGEEAGLEDEILGSKHGIERHLGIRCRHISWPYGKLSDADETSLRYVREAGYETCFGSSRRVEEKMLKVLILTSSAGGTAVLCLPELVGLPNVQVVGVVRSRGMNPSRSNGAKSHHGRPTYVEVTVPSHSPKLATTASSSAWA
jgi:hypothetical protein